jgi:iron complex outermembrane receptor protein
MNIFGFEINFVHVRISFFYVVCFWSLTLNLYGQSPVQDSIEVVTIKSLRVINNPNNTSLAVFRRDFTKTNFLKSQLSLQEYVTEAPGLFSLNATNYAQDLRISIRGFGARSAFGIRGIKLIIDGIPETTPDGQGQLDNLMLSTVSSLEVINGPSSALYGNASGGVIYIGTLDNVDNNYIEAGTTIGSYGLNQYSLNGGLVSGKTTVIANYLFTGLDGYRDQSSLEQHAANIKLIQDFDSGGQLRLALNYTNSPVADDPGGINLESVEENRRQARDRNVLFETGESINHSKLSAHYETPLKAKNTRLESYAFYSARNFEGLLPFGFGGWIDLARNYWGAGASLTQKQIQSNAVITSKIGFDFANQADNRQRFFNNEGVQGEQTLDQLETFRNIAFYYLGSANIGKVGVFVGLRYDINQLEAEDAFLSNGDDSGTINLSNFSQSLGLNYTLGKNLSAYANFRQSFETPALTELSSNPSGAGGFNQSLDPQSANNFEIGLAAKGARLNGNIALFYIRTKNDLVPFELEEFPDRDFFRNAGSSNRIGFELTGQYQLANNWRVSAMYSYSDFTYDDYFINGDQFSGNRLPAIPVHQGSWKLTYQTDLINVSLQQRYIGTLFTNDSNTVEDNAYSLFNLNAGFQLPFGSVELKPFFGINNIFNTLYNDNIRINAFGSRFFEPGQERNFYAGVKIRF